MMDFFEVALGIATILSIIYFLLILVAGILDFWGPKKHGDELLKDFCMPNSAIAHVIITIVAFVILVAAYKILIE